MRLARDFVEHLAREGLEYVMLGRPEDVLSGEADMDICVADRSGFARVLRRFCHKSGARLVRAHLHATGIRYDLALLDGEPELFMGPDLLFYPWPGKGRMPGMDPKSLVKRVRIHPSGARVLEPAAGFAMTLARCAWKNRATERHLAYLRETCQEEGGAIKAWCAGLGPKAAQALEAVGRDDLDGLRGLLPGVHGEIKAGTRPDPGRWWWMAHRTLRRLFRPSGLVVALLGPDGSGKSTVIENVRGRATRCFDHVVRFHLRPRTGEGGTIVTDPHGRPPRGVLGSVLKLAVFTALHWAGHLRHVLRWRLRSSLIIFDRYFNDMLVDPLRFRHGASLTWVRLFGCLLPRPDHFLILTAPAEVLQARKAEVPLEESERQCARYEELARGMGSRATLVDAGRTPEQVSDDALRAILLAAAQRTEKRLGWPGPRSKA